MSLFFKVVSLFLILSVCHVTYVYLWHFRDIYSYLNDMKYVYKQMTKYLNNSNYLFIMYISFVIFLFLNWERKFTCLCFHSVFCYNNLFPYTQETCPRRVFLHIGVWGCCMIFVESQSPLLSHRLVNTELSVSNSPRHSNHRFSTHLKILPSSGVSTDRFKSVCLYVKF